MWFRRWFKNQDNLILFYRLLNFEDMTSLAFLPPVNATARTANFVAVKNGGLMVL